MTTRSTSRRAARTATRAGTGSKRTLIAGRRYSNGARIEIWQVWDGDKDDDSLSLEYTTARGKLIGVRMRPDEAIDTIELLAQAVSASVKGYTVVRIKKAKRRR